ncbi:hypothetical protein MIR68_001866 [Amoeboaphelidium protococcarum]|nr:hypothetical protein MIR68_011872 [Amoeboaphelidium protococcarum]KAI3640988.1 hypothetical protein MIR68_001866 [Amoeboaphelidium protococcarum]KAI3651845.1 hypothetical protein MP228_003148 [Amoeboaphelidium protococcarum]
MLLFCPIDGNLLIVSQDMLKCNSCPFMKPINIKYTQKTELKRKKIDDILGGSKAWENVDTCDAVCPKCEHRRAYFMQIQIRSADEPASVFFKCVQCQNQWREG